MRLAPSLVLVTAACSSPSEPDVIAARQVPAAIRADVTSVAHADNQFAAEMYLQLVASSKDNAFFSPFSIATAFSMLDAGAAGATDTELRTALHIALPGQRAHAAVGAMLASLDTGRDFGSYTLATADRLFGQTGYPFLASYLTTTKQDYGAELMPLDFAHDPSSALAQVNAWVASQTDNQIPMLFGAGSIDDSTRLVLANAILFKGTWDRKFGGATAPAAFQLASGQTVQAEMMHKVDQIAVAAIPGGRIGVLPFHGNDLSMVIALPDQADGLPGIEAELSGDAIEQWIAGARAAEAIPVALPRFQLETSAELPALLAALGVTSVFVPTAADLSGIDGAHDLYVQQAVHKATISVDEDGAEAAAATGVGISTAVGVVGEFTADHPFVFVIFDHVTGTILFMGRVVDPTM